jgi:hypothetical protein
MPRQPSLLLFTCLTTAAGVLLSSGNGSFLGVSHSHAQALTINGVIEDDIKHCVDKTNGIYGQQGPLCQSVNGTLSGSSCVTSACPRPPTPGSTQTPPPPPPPMVLCDGRPAGCPSTDTFSTALTAAICFHAPTPCPPGQVGLQSGVGTISHWTNYNCNYSNHLWVADTYESDTCVPSPPPPPSPLHSSGSGSSGGSGSGMGR